ncbi:holin family protein [Tropicimonas sp. IMCC6043]|uniref:holin family protein n=1 Tax=Tropicimonas sp. IMCC6043 TaxID=2510645 RepID=UPI00101C7797|nr:holin family protein [Tropicimonas sp. IMCC6043]RYH10146.1 carboxylesterase [Tropicimonas sp. IMCC6043]
MGMIGQTLATILGGGRNVVTETVEVFRENAEKGATRDAEQVQAALVQFASEFAAERGTVFDRVVDGLNRIPRPAMAIGTLGLFVSAMVDPIWFASRMQSIALVPEPLWWLLGAIVGFYFGARHQTKGQEFQRSVAATLARASEVTEGIAALRALDAGSAGTASRIADASVRRAAPISEAAEAPADFAGPGPTGSEFADNAALAEWKHAHS